MSRRLGKEAFRARGWRAHLGEMVPGRAEINKERQKMVFAFLLPFYCLLGGPLTLFFA
jgi:hypothetical protein